MVLHISCGIPALACCLTSGNRLQIHSTTCAAAAHLLDACEVARQHGGRGVARRRLPPLRPLRRPPRPLGGTCCRQCRRHISDTRLPLSGRQLSACTFAACPQSGQCTVCTGRKQSVRTLCSRRLLGGGGAAGLFAGPRHGGVIGFKVGILIGWHGTFLGCICRPRAVKSLTGDLVMRCPVQALPSSYSHFQVQLLQTWGGGSTPACAAERVVGELGVSGSGSRPSRDLRFLLPALQLPHSSWPAGGRHQVECLLRMVTATASTYHVVVQASPAGDSSVRV